MAELREVPVVEVHTDNIREIWPSLVLAIKTSTFIALDTELSGLGDRKQLFAKSIDDRYKAMSDVAKTRSVIALGVSCFKLQPTVPSGGTDGSTANGKPSGGSRRAPVNFVVQTFNMFVLCAENYVVEPVSLRFLIEHGFDFNLQYSKGLPYTGGNDKPLEKTACYQNLRQLFVEIAMSHVPIVLHNSLVDLVFLYQSFYATLPSTLASFVTDLSQIFCNGIYDTKYLAEFKARMPASFLEYAFRKCQRGNCWQASNNLSYLGVSFLHYHEVMQTHVALLSCGLRDQPCHRDVGKTTLCQHFAGHGWCAGGYKCPNSHDVDMILDFEDCSVAKKSKKRARKKRKNGKMAADDSVEDAPVSEDGENCVEMLPLCATDQTVASDESDESIAVSSVMSVLLDEGNGVNSSCSDARNASAPSDSSSTKAVPPNRSGGHRAGFDAFMTGYIFASLFIKHGRAAEGATSLNDFGIAEELGNKVYLGGKDFPLQIAQSNFAKPSKLHAEKWERLRCTSAEQL